MALINQNFLRFQNPINLNQRLDVNIANEATAENGITIDDSANKVNIPSGTNNINEEEKKQILQEVKTALKEESEKWGFNNWKLTDEQIENLYNKLISDSSITSFNGTKEDFENLIKMKLTVLYKEILSNGIWNDFNFVSTTENVTPKETLQTFEDKINSDEFNKEVTKEEATEYINHYVEFIKADLIEKYNYSDSYIDNIISVVLDNIFKQQQQSGLISGRPGRSNPFTQGQEANTYNLQTILKQFKSEITNLLKEPKLAFAAHTGDLFDGNISPFSTQMLEAFSKNSNLQLQLLSKLFTSVIQEKGFNEDEANVFISLVFKDCGANINNSSGILSLTMEDLKKLDRNGDGSWFDELSNTINNVAKRYSHMEQDTIDNAQTIDAQQFIRDFATHGLTDYSMVEKLVMQLDSMMLSNDPAMRKLAQMLDKAFEKYNCQNNDEKKDLVKWFLNITAKRSGHEDTRYYLTKDDIENLNTKDVFAEFEEILESQELYYAYMVNIDGELGDFKQGSTGDCWLIAALIELKNSPHGREIVRDAIKHNEDGSVTVTFKGVNVSYTLSPEEIIEAEQGPAYSSGDNDVLILELATEKLRRDIASGKVKVPKGYDNTTPKGENQGDNNDNTSSDRRDDGTPGTGIWGGRQSQMLYFLTGNKTDKVCVGMQKSDDIKKACLNLLEDFRAGKVVLSLDFGGGCFIAPCANGEYFSIKITSGHAFAITDMTEDTITIVNPWDSTISYTFTWEVFAKLRFGSIQATRIA